MTREHADPRHWFSEAAGIMRSNFALAGSAVVVMAAIGVSYDLLSTWMNLLLLPVQLFFQYELTLAALAKSGLVERQGKRRLWALLGLGILNDFGIVLGLVLLVVPGLYLYVRWSLAAPILIAEGVGPVEALKRSGEEVSGRFRPVGGLFLLIGVPWVAGLIVGFLPGAFTLPMSVVSNILIYVSIVMSWCAAVAIYADDRTGGELADVFA